MLKSQIYFLTNIHVDIIPVFNTPTQLLNQANGNHFVFLHKRIWANMTDL